MKELQNLLTKFQGKIDFNGDFDFFDVETGKKKHFEFSELFESEDHINKSIVLLGQAVKIAWESQQKFKGLPSLLRESLGIFSASEGEKNGVEVALSSIETYVKTLLCMNSKEEAIIKDCLTKSNGLANTLSYAHTIGALTQSELFDCLRLFRNDESHGNEKYISPLIYKTQIADLIILLLLHITDKYSGKIQDWVFRHEKKASLETNAPKLDIAEQLREYVKKADKIYTSHLEQNVGRSELLPVILQSNETEVSVDSLSAFKPGVYLILGAPGAGKTTLLNNVLHQVCTHTDSEQQLIPLLIKLNNISSDTGLSDLIHQEFNNCNIASEAADTALKEGRMVIGFDGLNEFNKEVNINRFIKQVFDIWARNGSKNLFFFTGREYEFETIKKCFKDHKFHQTYVVRDIGIDDIRNYLKRIDLPNVANQRMFSILENPQFQNLMHSPLNFSIILKVVANENKKFTATNRGQLLKSFMEDIYDREDFSKDSYLPQILLWNLAMENSNNKNPDKEAFIDRINNLKKPQNDKPLFKENKAIEYIEDFIKASIIETKGFEPFETINFQLDTFCEYFIAQCIVDKLNWPKERPWLTGFEPVSPENLMNDDEFETLRLVLELNGDTPQTTTLVQKIFNKRIGERKTCNIENLQITEIPKVLTWACRLVSTLPYRAHKSGDTPCAKLLVESWLINYIKIVAAGLGNQAKLLPTLAQAAAYLSAPEAFRTLLSINLANIYDKNNIVNTIAEELVKKCSDNRLLFDIVSELSPKARTQNTKNASILGTVLNLLLKKMDTLQRELVERSLEKQIKDGDKTQIVYFNYFKVLVLLANIEKLREINMNIAAGTKLHITDFNLLLDKCIIDESIGKWLFGDAMQIYYKKCRNQLKYNLTYLLDRNQKQMVLSLLGQKQIRSILHSNVVRNILRRFDAADISDELIEEYFDFEIFKVVENISNGSSDKIKLSSIPYIIDYNGNISIPKPCNLEQVKQFIFEPDKQGLRFKIKDIEGSGKYLKIELVREDGSGLKPILHECGKLFICQGHLAEFNSISTLINKKKPEYYHSNLATPLLREICTTSSALERFTKFLCAISPEYNQSIQNAKYIQ